jgi:hypothetical protein
VRVDFLEVRLIDELDDEHSAKSLHQTVAKF